MLRPEVAGRAEMAQRFRSEIKLARKVRHENVCGIHEYGQDGARRYIAMEFVDGVNLRQLVREGKGLARREAFDLSIQAAHGLQAIHDAGIIHRDLKASNIMRDSQGLVRLMDFGIAKQHGADVTLHGTISGTPDYMSPEQASGQPLDYRSDIYALAVVVYELFTGKVPFKADTPVRTALTPTRRRRSAAPRRAASASVIPVIARPVEEPDGSIRHGAGMAKALRRRGPRRASRPCRESPTSWARGPLASHILPDETFLSPRWRQARPSSPVTDAAGLATATEFQLAEPRRPRLAWSAALLMRRAAAGAGAWPGGAGLILLGGVWAGEASMRDGVPDRRVLRWQLRQFPGSPRRCHKQSRPRRRPRLPVRLPRVPATSPVGVSGGVASNRAPALLSPAPRRRSRR